MPNPTTDRKKLSAQVAERRLDGLYKQRGENDYVMVRVRAPASQFKADALQVVSQLAEELGDGSLHFTTRGDVELHGVSFGDVDDTLARLGEVGLSTRGACGDCIRNVVACPGAGVCPNERVDTCALAHQLADALAGVPEYEKLPRKFKISVSGCEQGCAVPCIQDVGFVATAADPDTTVFGLYLAGGLGRRPMLAKEMSDTLTQKELIPFVRAAIACFDELGDRERRSRARLKFVAERLGHDELLARIKERMAR